MYNHDWYNTYLQKEEGGKVIPDTWGLEPAPHGRPSLAPPPTLRPGPRPGTPGVELTFALGPWHALHWRAIELPKAWPLDRLRASRLKAASGGLGGMQDLGRRRSAGRDRSESVLRGRRVEADKASCFTIAVLLQMQRVASLRVTCIIQLAG